MDLFGLKSKKMDQIHQTLIHTAIELISEAGSGAVTFESIAAASGVSIKTVEAQFKDMNALIKELVTPVCNHVRNSVNAMEETGQIELDDIWDFCLSLWLSDTLNPELFYHIRSADYPDIFDNTHSFITVFRRMLKLTKTFNACRDSELQLYARIIYNTYIPLLNSLKDSPNLIPMFKKGMNGLFQGLKES